MATHAVAHRNAPELAQGRAAGQDRRDCTNALVAQLRRLKPVDRCTPSDWVIGSSAGGLPRAISAALHLLEHLQTHALRQGHAQMHCAVVAKDIPAQADGAFSETNRVSLAGLSHDVTQRVTNFNSSSMATCGREAAMAWTPSAPM